MSFFHQINVTELCDGITSLHGIHEYLNCSNTAQLKVQELTNKKIVNPCENYAYLSTDYLHQKHHSPSCPLQPLEGILWRFQETRIHNRPATQIRNSYWLPERNLLQKCPPSVTDYLKILIVNQINLGC